MQESRSVFISYSHRDQPLARRLHRWLVVHGVGAWLDEQQLRVGTKLSAGLQRHIADCDTVVVVASAASADSKWVGLELDCAVQLGKNIVPWLVEPVASHSRFADHVGVAVAGPACLGESLERLLTSLCSAWDLPAPTARRDACEASLRDLCRQVPALEGLVLGCLDGPGLLGGSESSVAAAGFGPIDEALELLAEWEPSERIAAHLSWGFVELGAAHRALRRWVEVSEDGGVVLAVLADSAKLSAAQDDATLTLLERCRRPNNQALYGYIHRHADRLTEAQRQRVLRLIAYPVRRTPEGFGDVLANVAWRAFPDAPEVRQLWRRWITDGECDAHASMLATSIANAARDGLPGVDEIVDVLRRHVRGLLRVGERVSALKACRHIEAAADKQSPALPALLTEASGVSGTAEWQDWRGRDPAAAAFCGWYVHFVALQATGARDWLAALHDAKRMAELDDARNGLEGD